MAKVTQENNVTDECLKCKKCGNDVFLRTMKEPVKIEIERDADRNIIGYNDMLNCDGDAEARFKCAKCGTAWKE